jgi:DNA-binding Xre family transcriptional regulator
MGVDGKLPLCGGNFRPCRNQNLSRNPNDTLFWPDTGARRHFENCFIGDVLADSGKIAVNQFQYLRAGVAPCAETIPSAEAFQKHANNYQYIDMCCQVIFLLNEGVAKENVRNQISAEVVKLIIAERKRQGVSGNTLAEKTGLSQSLISTIETTPSNPTLDTLLRIGDALEIDVGLLISKARKSVLNQK